MKNDEIRVGVTGRLPAFLEQRALERRDFSHHSEGAFENLQNAGRILHQLFTLVGVDNAEQPVVEVSVAQIVLEHEVSEAVAGGESHLVTRAAETVAERHVRLDVSPGAVGGDEDFHIAIKFLTPERAPPTRAVRPHVDPLTHGLVGAAAAGATASSKRGAAACSGFVAALLADLDVLLSRADDPLYQLEFHRQFSHSLLFIPVGALIATLLLWWPMRNKLTPKGLYLACLSGYGTAGLLDACTSYGTQLLWPFSDTRIAWNLTPVVEPVITVGLLVLLGLFFVRRSGLWVWLALGWLALLLAHGAYRQAQALEAARDLWQGREHTVEQFVVKPTLGNQLLWRVTYLHEGLVYTDAVRTGLGSPIAVLEGESKPLVRVEEDFVSLQGTALFDSLLRFSRLSEGFLVHHPDAPNVVGDARYAMLPTSLTPLWGLEFDPEKPDQAVRFLTFRDAGAEARQLYFDMLFRPLELSSEPESPRSSDPPAPPENRR